MNYVVEISDSDSGKLVFRGTVSQKGDFVHLETYPRGQTATLRVHDMVPTLVEPVKLVDPPADQSWLKMEKA